MSLSLDDDEEDEEDNQVYPPSEALITWRDLTIDFESNDRQFSEIADICKDYGHKEIDMRPYMLAELYTVSSKDSMTKTLNLFRFMHLRHLPVLNDKTYKLEGIITRQDLFSYMSLWAFKFFNF